MKKEKHTNCNEGDLKQNKPPTPLVSSSLHQASHSKFPDRAMPPGSAQMGAHREMCQRAEELRFLLPPDPAKQPLCSLHNLLLRSPSLAAVMKRCYVAGKKRVMSTGFKNKSTFVVLEAIYGKDFVVKGIV